MSKGLIWDRDAIRLQVLNRVQSIRKGYRQNIAILGPEGVGKTSLLAGLARDCGPVPDIHVVFLHLDFLSLEHFADLWIRALIPNLGMGADKFEKQESLPEMHLPLLQPSVRTMERLHLIRKMLRKGERPAAVLQEILALPNCLAEDCGKKFVLVLDEFDLLENLPVGDPFSVFGKAITTSKNVLYVLSSSRTERAAQILGEKLSLLFGQFEILELRPLNFAETIRYLRQHHPAIDLSHHQSYFLRYMTGGFPVHMDLVLEQLRTIYPVALITHEQGGGSSGVKIPAEKLLKALHRELFDRRGRIFWIYERRMQDCRRFSKNSAPYVHALVAISSGRKKVSAIAAAIQRNQVETKKILARLVAEEWVVRRGSFYSMEDALFRFWVRQIFTNVSLRFFDEAAFTEKTESELDRMYREFLEHTRQPIAQLVEKLLGRFRNDFVELKDRQMKMPCFTEMLRRDQGAGDALFYAKSRSSKWLFYVPSGFVREEDVIYLLKLLKKTRQRFEKKFLITVYGIDQNARLLAQEAGVMIWELNDLNDVLTAYDLMPVVPGIDKIAFTKEALGFVVPELPLWTVAS
ncbi:MAG: hypothetical protein ACOY3K_01390 [Candidatus Omnitrophota bacterium]